MRHLSEIALPVALALFPLTAQAQDASQWAGFYGGVSHSSGSADQTYDDGGILDLEGDGPSIMAGYNYASGPWVFGGELAYSRVEIGQTDGDPFYFESFLDLKARAGYAVGNLLVYGTLGHSSTQWNENLTSGLDGNGMLYGVGMDYLVSPRIFVGAEYLVRDVTSDWSLDPTDTFDADVRTWTLRLGMKF